MTGQAFVASLAARCRSSNSANNRSPVVAENVVACFASREARRTGLLGHRDGGRSPRRPAGLDYEPFRGSGDAARYVFFALFSWLPRAIA